MSSHRRPHCNLLRHTATALALAMLAAGCTNTGQADPDPLPTDSASPTPTGTSSPSSTPSATPDGPTADQVLELVDEYRNVLLALPELPPDQAAEHISARAEELTTDKGTARQRLLDQATTIRDAADADLVPIMRGTPHTALLDEPSLSGDSWTTTACVATQGQFTDVTTGEPGELEPAESEYSEAEVALVEADGSWLVENYASSEEEDSRPCIPPTVAQAIAENWEAYLRARTSWLREGAPNEDLGPLTELVSGEALQQLETTAIPGGGTWEAADVDHDLQLDRATPTRVDGTWCLDPDRNPEAGISKSDGSFVRQGGPQLWQAQWRLVEGDWRLVSRVSLDADAPSLPEGGSRCF